MLVCLRAQCLLCSLQKVCSYWSKLFCTAAVFECIFAVSTNQLIVAERPNSVVPPALLCEVLLWRVVQSLSWDDVISRLRSRTVPAGFVYHAWKVGE